MTWRACARVGTEVWDDDRTISPTHPPINPHRTNQANQILLLNALERRKVNVVRAHTAVRVMARVMVRAMVSKGPHNCARSMRV